jgi:dTDP-4-dehydrorhamnose reductase
MGGYAKEVFCLFVQNYTSMHRILITGANGLLGQKLIEALFKEENTVFLATGAGPLRLQKPGIPYAIMDITQKEEVEQVCGSFKPTAIIHAAAMTHVDACEKEPEKCWAANVTAVQHVVDYCESNGVFLVHLSTDFIFDGTEGPYAEEAEPKPLSVYGRSKAEAETLVKAMHAPWAILRTVLVYGYTEGLSRSNIVLWARQALLSGQPLRVVNDQWRTPTLAEDLAWACLAAVKLQARGIFHISGAETYGIADLVRAVARFYEIPNPPITEVSSEELAQPAQRPPRTGFIIEKARKILGFEPTPLLEGLKLIESQIAHDPALASSTK